MERLQDLVHPIVSIHAPVKGATIIDRSDEGGTRCFNPRAREGRDMAHNTKAEFIRCFNPRAREGRDIATAAQKTALIVSIHAPVKGATYRTIFIAMIYRFQSTRP